jgi:hypothetical protein
MNFDSINYFTKLKSGFYPPMDFELKESLKERFKLQTKQQTIPKQQVKAGVSDSGKPSLSPAKKMFKEIANGAKIQVLPIIPIYAKVSILLGRLDLFLTLKVQVEK